MESADSEIKELDEGSTLELKRYLHALVRYFWLVAGLIALAVGGAVIYTKQQTPIYEASASVQIEPKLPDLLGTGDLFNVAAGGGQTVEYYKQQRLVIASSTLAQQTILASDFLPRLLSSDERATLSQVDQLEVATRRLRGRITVKYPEANRIMYVAVADPDPAFARDIANAHVTTYVNYAKGLLSQNSTNASDALQQEFNKAETKLRAAEDAIYKFQAENDMIAVTLEEHQSLVAANILAFSTKFNDAVAEEIKLSARLAEMKKQSAVDVLSSPIAMMGENATAFESLRTMYYTERVKLLELEKDLGPKNTEYLAQKQKVDEIHKAVEGASMMVIEGTRALHTAQVQIREQMAAQVERYKTDAKALSPKILVNNDLVRTKRGLEDAYNVLRTRLSATQMTTGMSGTISNVRPLDPALLPTVPISPSLRLNVLFAGLLALLIGSGFVLLIVFLDRSIKSLNDATSAGVPVLGLIPALSNDLPKSDVRSRDLYVHEHPASHIAECCRSLRTNIMLSAADHPPKTIVVSSANKGEGKTTSVIYLGTTMAQTNQRVLLVDSDMRRPRLHSTLNVERQPGLTNLILGEDVYDEVIKNTDIPNLFLLPCGPLPPNPAELLMSKRFEAVLQQLGERFDRIILDSPPLPYTDAVVLSKLSDGVIVVVRAGRTLRDDLKRSVHTFREVGATMLGTIVNEIDRRAGSYYYYSYYGYGEAEPKEPRRVET